MKTFKITGSLILAILMSLSFVSCDDDDDDDSFEDLIEGFWRLSDSSEWSDHPEDALDIDYEEYIFEDGNFTSNITEYDSGTVKSKSKIKGFYKLNGDILNMNITESEKEQNDKDGGTIKIFDKYNETDIERITVTYEDGTEIKRDTTTDSKPLSSSIISKIIKLTEKELVLISEKDTFTFER